MLSAMSDKSNASGGGIGLTGATFIVFLVLKLTGSITWSWWWVTAPLWGVFALVLAIAAIVVPIGLIAEVVGVRRARRHNEAIARSTWKK